MAETARALVTKIDRVVYGCINFCQLTPTQVIDDSDAALDGVIAFDTAYLANCAVRDDYTLSCRGSGISNVATAFDIMGTPLENIAHQTACGSAMLPTSIRYLTRADELERGAVSVTPLCP